jgi:hypothetical protein
MVLKWEKVFVRKMSSTSLAVESRIDLGLTMAALLIRIVGAPSCED